MEFQSHSILLFLDGMNTPNKERSLSLPQRPLLQSSSSRLDRLVYCAVGPRRIQLSVQETSLRDHGDSAFPRTPLNKQERLSTSRKRFSPVEEKEEAKTPEGHGAGERFQERKFSYSSEKRSQEKKRKSMSSFPEDSPSMAVPKNLLDTIIVLCLAVLYIYI